LHYCPFESLLAVGWLQGGVALYETNSYSLVATLERHDRVSSLEWLWLDHMVLLAVGGLDGTAVLYKVEMQVLETQGASVLYVFKVSDQVRSMTLSVLYHNTLLWTVGDKSGTVTLCTLQVDKNDTITTLLDKNMEYYSLDSGILALAVNTSATFLAIATKSGQVIVRRIEQQQQQQHTSTTTILTHQVFGTQRLGPVRSAVFTQDERRFIFGGYDKTVVVVDTRLWAITRELKVQGTINVLSLDSKQRYLAVGARDKSLVLYDTSSWCPLKTIHTPGWVTSISWSTTEKPNVVAVRSEAQCISILDMTPMYLTNLKMTANNDAESSTSWTRNGYFVARTKGNLVVIADARNGFKDVASLDTGGYVRSLAFCTAQCKSNLLAVVNTAGYFFILKLVIAESKVTLETQHSAFVEEHLWVVAWSTGEFIPCRCSSCVRARSLPLTSASLQMAN